LSPIYRGLRLCIQRTRQCREASYLFSQCYYCLRGRALVAVVVRGFGCRAQCHEPKSYRQSMSLRFCHIASFTVVLLRRRLLDMRRGAVGRTLLSSNALSFSSSYARRSLSSPAPRRCVVVPPGASVPRSPRFLSSDRSIVHRIIIHQRNNAGSPAQLRAVRFQSIIHSFIGALLRLSSARLWLGHSAAAASYGRGVSFISVAATLLCSLQRLQRSNN